MRVRFFLLVWTLVVSAMLASGLLLARWSVVELNRVSVRSAMLGEVPTSARVRAWRSPPLFGVVAAALTATSPVTGERRGPCRP